MMCAIWKNKQEKSLRWYSCCNQINETFYTKEMIDLTGTCALEHFTSTIAAELLQNPEIQAMFQRRHYVSFVDVACS